AGAKPYLKQYLQSNDGDYQTNYAYGEILKRKEKDREGESAMYFQKALSQISELDDKNTETLLDQAQLLYLNHKSQEAIQLLYNLLAKDPKNKDVRADLAS